MIEVLMQAMAECRERSIGFVDVYRKDGGSTAKDVVTNIDLANQEHLLEAISSMDVTISVEERINDPTLVQKKLYANNEALSCVYIDGLDGTLAKVKGLDRYGIFVSIVERSHAQMEFGKIKHVLVYFPEQDRYLVAEEKSVRYGSRGGLKPLEVEYLGHWVTTPSMDVNLPKVHGMADYLLEFVEGNPRKLFVDASQTKTRGQYLDLIPGCWVAKQLGISVEYERYPRKDIGIVPFGDIVEGRRRILHRDECGPLKIGRE